MTGKTIYIQCTNRKCLAGTQGHYTDRDGTRGQNKISIELRPGQWEPRLKGSPMVQSCPNCEQKTLIKA